MSEQWRIEMLGGLRVLAPDANSATAPVKFPRRKSGALLGYLAFHAGQTHLRQNLAEVLWPDSAPEAGRISLRVALSELRAALEKAHPSGDALILSDKMEVRFNSEIVATDVKEFEAILKQASGASNLNARARGLCDAVDLYRGELLRGHEESWIVPEARCLEEAFFVAVRQLLELLEAGGDHQRALRYAHHAVNADPLREESHFELIRLCATQGHADDAVLHFRRLETILRRNFHREPALETRELVALLLPSRRSKNARKPSVPASIKPLGQPGANGYHKNGSAPGTPSTKPALVARPQVWPGGAVTFLLLDNLSSERGTADKAATLCRAELRELVVRHSGREVGALRADSLWALFRSASDALSCALAMRRAIRDTPRMNACCGAVRIALDTGDSGLWAFPARENAPLEHAETAIERATLDRALEVLAAAHSEQTLCSEVTGALLRRELEAGVTLDDLGVYRLRASALPERLYQVSYPGMAQRVFPSPNAAPMHSGQLPTRITNFFGREDELAQVVAWLTPAADARKSAIVRQEPPTPHCRLVTLTGFGGCGKTRLAIESASRLRAAYAGAVWFVPLADLSEPQLIANSIVEAMHLPGAPGLEPWRQLVSTLGEKSSLLVLDNFEQLCADGAEVVRRLLAEAPGVSLLVTSRRRLSVSGERDLAVRPLPLPHKALPEAQSVADGKRFLSLVSRNPSVQIFEDRARNAQSDFQLTPLNADVVTRLCRVLEGVPLALELAAAHVRRLTPAQMVTLLESHLGGEGLDLLHSAHDDTPDRHRTLRAAIEWSYELLDAPLREAFSWLSVFRGGWTLAAANVITGQAVYSPKLDDEESEATALDNLMRLQDASLVQTEEYAAEMRFSMLEMLRQFGGEQLNAGERERLYARHAAYFSDLAEQASANLMDAERDEWLRRLDPEIDNLRAALNWFLEREPARCLQMAGALWRFWEARGHFAEGRDWLERALSEAQARAERAARRETRSEETRRHGDTETRRHESGDSITSEVSVSPDSLSPHSASPHSLSPDSASPGLPLPLPLYLRALNGAARLAWYRADFKVSQRYLEESLSLARTASDANSDNRRGIANALHSLGLVAMCQGDASARAMLMEGLSLVSEQGDQRIVKDFMLGLALVRFYLAEPGVRELLQEALEISRELGDWRGIAFALNNLGLVEGIEKNFGLAREYHEQALPFLRATGDQWSTARALGGLGRAAWFEHDISAARAYYVEKLHILRDLGSRWELVYAFEGFAWLALHEDNPQHAALLLGACETLCDTTGHVLFPVARPCYDDCVAHTHAALGALGDPIAAAAAWRAGRALSREEAIAAALKK